MQDWFFVQDATYGSYYIDVEINNYGVYRVSLSYYNPDTNLVNYSTDETTTGNKAYARRRYKQLMKKAEENDYGWNYSIENPVWEFRKSDWESTQQYIFSSSSKPSKSKYQFKWVESEYTGGAIYVVWGQLADGNYFCGNDCEYWIFIVDENPGEYHNGEDYDGFQYLDDFNWIEEHTVKKLSEKAQLEFWLDLVNYCKRSNIDFCSNDYNGLIKSIKDCLKYYD